MRNVIKSMLLVALGVGLGSVCTALIIETSPDKKLKK